MDGSVTLGITIARSHGLHPLLKIRALKLPKTCQSQRRLSFPFLSSANVMRKQVRGCQQLSRQESMPDQCALST
jgi:hypothetical protein